VEYLIILVLGVAAGTLSGIIGFGASMMLMPVLVLSFGPLQAVPVMAIAAVMANLSRVLAWWREVDWRACAAYGLVAGPAAALGARSLLELSTTIVEAALGVFFLLMIPTRHWLAARAIRVTPWHLALLALPIGFLTGIVATTGPITVPLFLAYGLVKGAFLATEAAGSLIVYLAKVLVFREFGVLPLQILLKGLITGSALMVGSFLARRLVLRLDARRFQRLMDGLMLLSGATMLCSALL